uniref:UDENN domain-containing protein n=1 Tax=Sus scrofa TaxID=9823 RepID=A0A8D0S2I5_PIG
MYLKHGSPVKMMESYIAVLTKGICQSEENGSFLSKDFDARKAYLAGSIKDIVSQFGMETVILHTALMLKKRIVVYHPKIEAVQEFTRTLPALVWHRQDWTILHSYVHLDADELEALQMCPVLVVSNLKLAKVMPVSTILSRRNPRRKALMRFETLCSSCAPNVISSSPSHTGPLSDAGYVAGFVDLEDISLKTKEIFTNLAPFSEVSDDGEKRVLNYEALKQRRFPPATENFLYHLAAAEQMLKI